MDFKVHHVDNAVYGCSAETFDAANKSLTISGIALPVTPHDGQAESLEIVKRKEFRLVMNMQLY